MRIEQNIVDAIEVSKLTKIPVLFMSNPGLGKTTILKRYAHNFNYHLETLIGSRFTPEEISGYQVNNGGDHLQHMNPEWFNRILEKSRQGQRTLLFIDELSTCSEFVQGALLSLIFDRTIGNDKMLPDDCFIIAAANYAQNLPSTMSLIAPTLNRFIIINLNDKYTAFDMLNEFMTPPVPVVYHNTALTFDDQYKVSFMETIKKIWENIFITYSDPRSSTGYLDIGNHNINNIYQSEGSVYNFISGRTISYLSRVLFCCKQLGLTNYDIIGNMIDGLVGAGTCQFNTEEQAKKYRELLRDKFVPLVFNLKTDTSKFMSVSYDLSKDVAAFLTNLENVSFTEYYAKSQLNNIMDEMYTFYNPNELAKKEGSVSNITKFVSNTEALLELRAKLNSKKKYQEYTPKILKLLIEYYSLYCAMTNIPIDYQTAFGISYKYGAEIYKLRTVGKDNTHLFFNCVLFNGANKNTYFNIINDDKALINLKYESIKNLPKNNNFELLRFSRTEKKLKFVPLKQLLSNNIM